MKGGQGGALVGFDLQDFRAALKKELSGRVGRAQTAGRPAGGLLIPNFVSGEESPEPSHSNTSFYSRYAASQRCPFPARQPPPAGLPLARGSHPRSRALRGGEGSFAAREQGGRADSCLTAKGSDVQTRISSIAARLRSRSPERSLKGVYAGAGEELKRSARAEPTSFLRGKDTPRDCAGGEVAQIRAFKRVVEAMQLEAPERQRCVDELIELARTITIKVKSSRF